jgi:hypothetical protein
LKSRSEPWKPWELFVNESQTTNGFHININVCKKSLILKWLQFTFKWCKTCIKDIKTSIKSKQTISYTKIIVIMNVLINELTDEWMRQWIGWVQNRHNRDNAHTFHSITPLNEIIFWVYYKLCRFESSIRFIT